MMAEAGDTAQVDGDGPADALAGLFAPHKSLPSWLLYDDAGCALYERITALPEYYLPRAETDILAHQADAILAQAAEPGVALALAEIGAGTATRTELLIAAALRRQSKCVYLACDIAPAPLAAAASRLRGTFTGLEVRTFAGTHGDAGPAIAALTERQVLLFLGSSIGNDPDPKAGALLAAMRPWLRDDARLVLGTDLKKDPRVLHAAYDDAQGVTAAFSLNLLARLNREYGCTFRLDAFRHVAEWDAAAANIEIFLVAQGPQHVTIGELGRDIAFVDGERIHIETSAKYDAARVDRILASGGFERVATFLDSAERYAIQLAQVAPTHRIPTT
ncbi:MAG: L-histidine N(alpha)-methyltransferase [Ardenticatenales bacterium]